MTLEEDDEISVNLRLPISNAKLFSFPITSLKLNASGIALIEQHMAKVNRKNSDFSKVYINEIDELRKRLNASQNSLRKMKNLKSSKRKTI